ALQAAADAAALRAAAASAVTPGLIANLPPLPPSVAAGVIAWARSRIGAHYVWGAAGPDAFDCSGLVLWAWSHAGRGNLPHSSKAMYAMSQHIAVSALQPGDLVFFGSPVHHVGLYVGNGLMLDALNSHTPVTFHSIFGISETPLGGRI
ncbi:MAG: hypothetical protein JWM05_43, partial [Acidimicrobiales bacterium]|nr:hypothetical protein [Acidimicrobiales bacterium]